MVERCLFLRESVRVPEGIPLGFECCLQCLRAPPELPPSHSLKGFGLVDFLSVLIAVSEFGYTQGLSVLAVYVRLLG